MKKLLSIVLALSLCLTAMMGCFVVSAETTNKVTVETVKIMPETATTEVDIAFDFDDYFAASKFTVDFTGLALAAIDYDETVVSIAHGATDGDVDVFDGITSLTCILDAVNAQDLGAFTDVVITLTFNTTALAAGDYAITFTGDVAHAGTYDPDTGWTGDEDTIDYTATAGAIHVHTVVVDEAVDADCVNTGLTEGSHCSACEEVLVAQTETPATGEHNYVDGVCSVCGDEEEVAVQKIAWAGSNITLGSALNMNFLITQANIATLGTTDNYAVVTTTFADGTADDVKTIPQSEWEKYNGGSVYWNIKSNGIPAKNMGDEIKVTIYNAKGQAITDERVDSPLLYANRALAANQPQKVKTLIVDMLNYGAASQTQLHYDEENLVNAGLTEAQKALATPDFEYSASNIKGTNNVGSNLSLESEIYLNFFFSNITNDMTAKVIYEDWQGNEVEYEIAGSKFEYYNATTKKVVVDTLNVADGFQQVRVEVYNGETMVAYGEDSVISYCARGLATAQADFYDAVAKFVKSSYNYVTTA